MNVHPLTTFGSGFDLAELMAPLRSNRASATSLMLVIPWRRRSSSRSRAALFHLPEAMPAERHLREHGMQRYQDGGSGERRDD
jgi:hypothetical protein